MLGIVLHVLYPCIVSYCIIIIVTAGAFVCEDDRWGGLLIVEGGERDGEGQPGGKPELDRS